MKKLLLLTIGMLLVYFANADIPEGYYSDADGLTGDALKYALHDIIDDHTGIAYGEARYILDETDKDPSNSSNIILIYTGSSISGTWDAGVTWNREHVWSQSHGFPDTDNNTIGPGSDLHNLKPSNPSVNTARSDKDFDEGGTQHSIATECFYTTNTWEPRDAVKGDVARIMLYMAVRYQGDVSGELDLELIESIPSSSPEFGVLSTLLKWHNDDPVDDFERNRNDIIYTKQNNRNPFIDHPEYAAKIWGGDPSPTISDITHSPETPSSNETVSVSATITDEGTVTSAELHWGLSSDALDNTILLTNSSGDTYIIESDIPAQTDGTTVYYEIEASNNLNVTALSQKINYTIDNNPSIKLLNEDFENSPGDGASLSLTGWTNHIVVGSRDWISKEYNANKYAQYSSYTSGEENESWLISPTLDLNSYIDESFSFDVNIGYWTHEALTIYISTDFDGSDISGATWEDITSNFTIPSTPTVDYGTFASAGTLDLSTYNGSATYIAFVYNGNGSTGLTTTIQIDNVNIIGYNNITNGIENIVANKISLYPVPASNELNIEVKNYSGNLDVQIYNIIGSLVYTEKSVINNSHNISLSDLKSGIYFIKISYNGKKFTQKILIDKE